MSETYVFDTEAIVAFLYDEPGAARVSDVLDDVEAGTVEGVLAETNASEVFYYVARIEGSADDEPTPASVRAADRDIRALSRRGVAIERADWRRAGRVKADGDVSLGDAHAVALADERDATLLVGADDDFDALPVELAIERFRDHGV